MPTLKVWLKRAKKGKCPSSPVVRTPHFHCRGLRVRSLVRELRSYELCVPCGKKKKKKRAERVKKSLLHLERMFWTFGSLHSYLSCALFAFSCAWEAGPLCPSASSWMWPVRDQAGAPRPGQERVEASVPGSSCFTVSLPELHLLLFQQGSLASQIRLSLVSTTLCSFLVP